MGDSAASNESIYQASLVTEQRALQGRQDAIDIMQRLLAQMGDDPLLTKTKDNLMKILENPEVITDEVFNNIMSKTGEVLDTNYDQQVQEVLGAARSKGVSGPALQATLQKAKEARASSMASAYRDALIERASAGLKTNMDAITSASNLLTQLFDSQRVLTTDIANVMRETVEAPFRNYGATDAQAASVPGAGGGGGAGGGSSAGVINYPESTFRQDAQSSYDAMVARNAAYNAGETGNTVYGNQTNGQPGTAESQAAALAGASKAVPGTPGVPVPMTADEKLAAQGPESGTGVFSMNGKKYTVDANGKITLVGSGAPGTTPVPQTPSAISAIPQTALSTQVTPTGSIASVPSSPYTADIQAAVKNMMAPLSSASSIVQNQFKPATSTLAAPKVLGAAYNNGSPYVESTLTSPAGTVSAGGGAAEASRGQQLIQDYGMDNVIGTTAGYGVRSSDVKGYGGTGTQYPTATGSASAGATVAQSATTQPKLVTGAGTGKGQDFVYDPVRKVYVGVGFANAPANSQIAKDYWQKKQAAAAAPGDQLSDIYDTNKRYNN